MTSAFFACAACEAGPAVQVLGESTRLEESRPSPRESAIFDGRRVELEGARGETLGVEVRVHDRGRARTVRLTLPANAAVVEGFEVRSLEVSEPSSSMYGPSLGRGRYPDVLVPLSSSARVNGLAYFDVAIPRFSGNRSIPIRFVGEIVPVEGQAYPATTPVASPSDAPVPAPTLEATDRSR
jgi:hypothetical protein